MAPARMDTERSAAELTNNVAALPPDVIDVTTFAQILEMDEGDGDQTFSRELVYSFFAQAETTFQQMDGLFESRDMNTLSEKGHFLKGSSAALGLTKLKDSCEKIQNLGAGREDGGAPDSDANVKGMLQVIRDAKSQFLEAEKALRGFYGDVGGQATAA